MVKYVGYEIERRDGQVTITSPSGKLVHAFAAGTDYGRDSRTALAWVQGLTDREPDPDAERIGAQCEFIGRIKRENPRGSSGEAECPFCKNVVRWRLAASNGHILARCTTADCFGLME